MKKYLVHAVPFTDTQNVTIRFKIPIPLIVSVHGSIERFLDFFGGELKRRLHMSVEDLVELNGVNMDDVVERT